MIRCSRTCSGRRDARAYSLLETMITILIIQIVSTMVVCSVVSANTTTRLDALSKRITGLLRYSRMLAMSSGQPVNIDFNPTTNTITAYLGSSTTPIMDALFPNGQCQIKLGVDDGLSGTSLGTISNSATYTASGVTIYRCTYGSMGTRTNAPTFTQPMTVNFARGSTQASITIPNAGDPG